MNRCGGQVSCGGQATTSRPTKGILTRAPGRKKRTVRSSQRALIQSDQTRVKMSFKLPYHCSFGQELALVGSANEMGKWEVQSGVGMHWTEGDVWVVEFEVLAGQSLDVEYKYVVRNATDGHVVCWKPGSNYQIQVPIIMQEDSAVAEGVRVRDAWDGSIKDIQLEVTQVVQDEALAPGEGPPHVQQWTVEMELEAMESAMGRALEDLEDARVRAEDMMGATKDPTSPELLQADRLVAAAARKAVAMTRALSAANSLTQQVLSDGSQGRMEQLGDGTDN